MVLEYFIIAGVFLLITVFIKGYKLETYSLMDIVDALIWPIAVANIIGTFTRVLIEKYKGDE